MRTKMLSLVLTLCLLLTLLIAPSVSAQEAALFVPGVYTAVVAGHNADITIEVKVTEHAIVSAKAVSHKETPLVSDIAFERVLGDIVEYQSLSVDTVAGCTVTSAALRYGVRQAIEPACSDISVLQAAPEKAALDATPIVKEADVIVVGGGGAGLAAAVTAAENGASVILIDKMATLGGNTIISGGGLNAADPERQNPRDIDDSAVKHYNQTYEAGDMAAKPELVRLMTDGALDAVQWLESMGFVWRDSIITVAGGLWPRGHGTIDLWPNGTQIIQVLQDRAEKLGVEIVMETEGTELIMDGERVVGVSALQQGEIPVTLNAGKGVIMATGGFGANVDMRVQYNSQWPTLDSSLRTTNAVSATGDGILMGEAVGASLYQMEYIQLLPYGDPTTGGLEGLAIKDPMDCIYVNKEGERFVSEYERRDVMTHALMEQTDAFMYIIFDKTSYPEETVTTPFGLTIVESVAKGECVQADTIEELALLIDIDPEVLRATVDKYNEGVESGVDEFNKALMAPLNNPPYYANPRIPSVHHTMGGLEINESAEVLDANGAPIPGFYAAGEVTGGIHGANRVGGNAIADIIVFGRIAGESVTAE